jgi:hypothetical protein
MSGHGLPRESLLGLCATPASSREQLEAIQVLTQDERVWHELPERAEREGLAPLVRHHLANAGVRPPREVERALHGLWLRHRKLAEARLEALGELLRACVAEGIELMLLKGAGLSHLAYPDPSLRPMRDLDVLVHGHDVERAAKLLHELG